jgi:hypothetical protein
VCSGSTGICISLGLVEFPTERERLVHLGVVSPFEPSGRAHAPRTEDQEKDHGGDVWRKVLAQSLDSFTAEEALADSGLVVGRLLDIWPRAGREALLLHCEPASPVEERQLDGG